VVLQSEGTLAAEVGGKPKPLAVLPRNSSLSSLGSEGREDESGSVVSEGEIVKSPTRGCAGGGLGGGGTLRRSSSHPTIDQIMKENEQERIRKVCDMCVQ
jgi:hypothetical protein